MSLELLLRFRDCKGAVRFKNNKATASFKLRLVKLPVKLRFVSWSKLDKFTLDATELQLTDFKLVFPDRFKVDKLVSTLTALDNDKFSKRVKVGKLKLVPLKNKDSILFKFVKN